MKTNVLVMCLIVIPACIQGPGEPAARTEPATSEAVSALGNTCFFQCRSANVQCNATCERFPRPNCEDTCEQRNQNCVQSCGCPFSEEFDEVAFDHRAPTTTSICLGNVPAPGVRYQVYSIFERIDHIRETLECDYTTTHTVVSSTYVNGQCNHRLLPDEPCTPSVAFPTGLCTF
jgi:hypothetical protein